MSQRRACRLAGQNRNTQLRLEGWTVNHKRVQRIWREEELLKIYPPPTHLRMDNGPEFIANAL